MGRDFSRGAPPPDRSADFFSPSLLDDATKERLCRDLLAEFGARNIGRVTSRGELIHSCCLPFGQHRNGDANPSASINVKKLTYRCLGCGAGGGLLWWIASCRGEDGPQARAWLGEQTGIGGTVMAAHQLVEILEGIFAQHGEARAPMPQYPPSMLEPWAVIHPYMTDTDSSGGIACRGIPQANCRKFQIGYAREYPMGPGRPTQERIVIPIFWANRLIGWQARRINPNDKPKYINSPELPRDRVLYGWEPRRDIVLVESPMSVLRHVHHQAMVATFGKVITDEQVRILHGARTITVWFDPDEGGWQGTERAITELKAHVPVRVVDWPYRDTDPADVDDATVDQRVRDAMPWSLWRRPGTLVERKG